MLYILKCLHSIDDGLNSIYIIRLKNRISNNSTVCKLSMYQDKWSDFVNPSMCCMIDVFFVNYISSLSAELLSNEAMYSVIFPDYIIYSFITLLLLLVDVFLLLGISIQICLITLSSILLILLVSVF